MQIILNNVLYTNINQLIKINIFNVNLIDLQIMYV